MRTTKRIQGIADSLKQERPYASFFEGPDKQIKEQGVVQTLLKAMESKGEEKYFGPARPPSSGDPPDCVVSDRDGKPVAVEVTEFVSKKAIEKNLKIERDPKKTWQDSIYRHWEPTEVITEINDIIQNKDGKTFKGGPYEKKILLIFTDEETLVSRRFEYARLLPEQSFGSVKQIDEVYLLFSPVGRAYPCSQEEEPFYDPAFDEGYPYIKLSLG